MLYQWRVTKYNPRYRKGNGYHQDDWTSVSDIGKSFQGHILDIDSYLTMEDRYVSSALHFFSNSGVGHLTVVSLEQNIDVPPFIYTLNLSNIMNSFTVHEGMVIRKDQFDTVCRLNLRELIWCKLEQNGLFFVHFGYDYYMYIGCAYPCAQSVHYAQSLGLFVEHYASPYYES